MLILSYTVVTINTQPLAFTKANPTKVYIYYMPFFSATENPGPHISGLGNTVSLLIKSNALIFRSYGYHSSFANSLKTASLNYQLKSINTNKTRVVYKI